MSHAANEWTLEGFVEHFGFVDHKMPDHKFVWVLGAGVSLASIKDFKYENRAGFYPRIYERRFRNYPDEGFAYLESVLSRNNPSPGYSVLAAALAANPPRHNAVITTNFDNLVADALSIYTDTFPFAAATNHSRGLSALPCGDR